MGVVDKLPEQWKTKKTADAVMAPSAIVLGGVGAAAAVVLGLPALAVIGVGVARLARPGRDADAAREAARRASTR